MRTESAKAKTLRASRVLLATGRRGYRSETGSRRSGSGAAERKRVRGTRARLPDTKSATCRRRTASQHQRAFEMSNTIPLRPTKPLALVVVGFALLLGPAHHAGAQPEPPSAQATPPAEDPMLAPPPDAPRRLGSWDE